MGLRQRKLLAYRNARKIVDAVMLSFDSTETFDSIETVAKPCLVLRTAPAANALGQINIICGQYRTYWLNRREEIRNRNFIVALPRRRCGSYLHSRIVEFKCPL